MGKHNKVSAMGKHKEVSCKVCFKSMRSDNVSRHMKIHIIHTLENNEQMCHELLDKVIEPEEQSFTTKRKYDGKHDTQDDQPSIKRKSNMCNDCSDIWACYNCNRWKTDE